MEFGVRGSPFRGQHEIGSPALRTPNSKWGFTTEAQSGVAFDRAHAEVRNQSSSSCSSSCSCSKRGGINWTGFVCPLRSACFVGRRSLQKGAVRATSPRPAMGRASLLANQVSSRLTVAQQSSGALPRDISSFRECCAFRCHSDHPRPNRVDSFPSTTPPSLRFGAPWRGVGRDVGLAKSGRARGRFISKQSISRKNPRRRTKF